MAATINMKDKFRRLISPALVDDYNPDNDEFGWSTDSDDIPDIKFATDCFVSMVGGRYDFYGMDLDGIKLNDMVFQILEDPDDGYRSHLGAARIAVDNHRYTFFHNPISEVIITTSDQLQWRKEVSEDFNGYVIVDARDNHVWGLIGTGNTDDYYPYFVCNYFPKAPGEER